MGVYEICIKYHPPNGRSEVFNLEALQRARVQPHNTEPSLRPHCRVDTQMPYLRDQ
jgi:hypothetical protein